MPRWTAVLLLLAAAPALAAQEPAPIEDNSFIIEEAYNQEPRVVQHLFTHERTDGAWAAAFGQEWPVGSLRHQLSYELTLVDVGLGAGIGDGAVNYRYQLVGGEGRNLHVAPRVSALLPLGSRDEGRGTGAAGAELNIPVSISVHPRLVLHANAGSTVLPSVDGPAGESATLTHYHAGGSMVFLAAPWINLLVESLWLSEQGFGASGVERESRVLLNPGVRFALQAGAVQVVPGASVIIDPDGDEALFLYLSAEHPF